MSTERVFNIFIYFNEGSAIEYGVRHHRFGGRDSDKVAFLLAHIEQDHRIARRFRLPRSFKPDEWLAAVRHGGVLGYFEGLSGFSVHLRRQCPASHRLSMGLLGWTDKLGLNRTVVTW